MMNYHGLALTLIGIEDMQNCIEENLDFKHKEYQEHLGAQRTPKR
jgi:hypothetical protein